MRARFKPDLFLHLRYFISLSANTIHSASLAFRRSLTQPARRRLEERWLKLNHSGLGSHSVAIFASYCFKRVFNRTRAHVPTCLYVLLQLAVKTRATPFSIYRTGDFAINIEHFSQLTVSRFLHNTTQTQNSSFFLPSCLLAFLPLIPLLLHTAYASIKGFSLAVQHRR